MIARTFSVILSLALSVLALSFESVLSDERELEALVKTALCAPQPNAFDIYVDHCRDSLLSVT